MAFTALAHDTLTTPSHDTFTVTMTGDILLDRGVRRVVERQGMERLFSAGVDSLFQTSDCVVANLECPATKVKAPVNKLYIFRAEPEWLDVLRQHGVTHLNLANNHTIDQGREGLIDTQQNILAAGMTPIGAGQNMHDAVQPVLLGNAPRSIWMLASLQMTLENYAYLPDKPCVSQESIDSLCMRIRQLKTDDPTCYVIVSLHWGWENHTEVVPQQRQEARRIIDAGADCMVCHHTHTRQEVEYFQGKPVFYSLGNFIFDPVKDINRHGAVVRLTIGKKQATAEEIPIVIKQCTPVIEN